MRVVAITLCMLVGACEEKTDASPSDDTSDDESSDGETKTSANSDESASTQTSEAESTSHAVSHAPTGDTSPGDSTGPATTSGAVTSVEPGVPHADAGPLDAGAKLHWYQTCGDPVCREDTPDSGVAACAGQMTEGAPCSEAGAQCDAQLGCGAMLICAAEDPRQSLGGCPISRARFKRNIEYVSNAQRETMARQVLDLPLATYTYREDPEQKPQLGFILEDVEPSLVVDSKRDQVNLYAYTSFVVAALQEQQKEIERLREQLQRLEADSSKANAALECSGSAKAE